MIRIITVIETAVRRIVSFPFIRPDVVRSSFQNFITILEKIYYKIQKRIRQISSNVFKYQASILSFDSKRVISLRN